MSHPLRWAAPPYSPSLADVLPAVLASLGVGDLGGPAGPPPAPITLAPARRAVVALVDGLGAEQLARRSGHAPFLRGLSSPVPVVYSGFPSTTASSLASFGTGLSCGQHGLIGTMAPTPDGTRLFSHLSWEGGPAPAAYQPAPTLLARAEAAGVQVTTVSRRHFARSGLTTAALAGGNFRPAQTSDERVSATVAAVRDGPDPSLTYVDLDEVDKAGHVHGPDSWQWGEAVETADATLRQIAERLPAGTSVTVTADHGMVAAPLAQRYDLAEVQALGEDVRMLGGDPRAGHVFCRSGAATDVEQRWREVLGEDAQVCSREQAIEAGWFGPVTARVRPRIGDVLTAMTGQSTVVDSASMRPAFLALVGHHGSMTEAETSVPVLHRSG
ncbi:MAG: alkaline phosphatase family protein [Ornithinimicrobium sp.]